MYDTARDLIDSLAAAPDALEGALAGVDTDLAGRARGGDEGWSVIEIVCHLRDAEERAVERVRAIRAEAKPRLAAYDQDAWATERGYARADMRAALAVFARHRSAHLAELRALAPDDWRRQGVHEEAGPISIENHTIHIATHDVQHLAQIARALQAARAAEVHSGTRAPAQ